MKNQDQNSLFKNAPTLTRAILSNQPSYMVLFVTAVCNARCPMCFYWEEIESANAKLELRLEEYEQISQKLDHLHYLSIGGGEPFIRKDLSQIVELFYRNSRTRIVTVATNGGFPERVDAYLEHLHQNCPDIQLRVQLSIDNLHKKHDENRLLKGLFDKLMMTAEVIKQKKCKGIPILFSVGTVLTPLNRYDLTALRTFLDENIAYDDLSLIYPRGNAKDPAYKEVTLREYRLAKSRFESIETESASFARIYQSIDRRAKRGIENYLENGPDGYPWTCVAGKKMITLTERGLVTPCEMLYQIRPEVDSDLGNVRNWDYDIPKMLQSSKANNLRRYIEETPCTCSYECAALCNVVFTKRQWPLLLKDVLKKSRLASKY